jgi:hypothetical protein
MRLGRNMAQIAAVPSQRPMRQRAGVAFVGASALAAEVACQERTQNHAEKRGTSRLTGGEMEDQGRAAF